MPYTPDPVNRKASEFLQNAIEAENKARKAIYNVFRSVDPVKINRAMAEALECLDEVNYWHKEIEKLHIQKMKRGSYKKDGATND